MYTLGITAASAKLPARASAISSPKAQPAGENLPEIVVEGTRIPWYVWAIMGAVAVLALTSRK